MLSLVRAWNRSRKILKYAVHFRRRLVASGRRPIPIGKEEKPSRSTSIQMGRHDGGKSATDRAASCPRELNSRETSFPLPPLENTVQSSYDLITVCADQVEVGELAVTAARKWRAGPASPSYSEWEGCPDVHSGQAPTAWRLHHAGISSYCALAAANGHSHLLKTSSLPRTHAQTMPKIMDLISLVLPERVGRVHIVSHASQRLRSVPGRRRSAGTYVCHARTVY